MGSLTGKTRFEAPVRESMGRRSVGNSKDGGGLELRR
jgi:hypothetical protein